MTEDLDRLDVLAAAATPGPWEARGAFVDTPEHDGAIAETYTTNFDRPGDPYADAAFIAACDPATIRSLVAAVRERDEARLAIDENREAYREQMEVVVRERDELREALNDAAQDAHDASTQGHVHRGESYLACPAPSCAKRAALHREDEA